MPRSELSTYKILYVDSDSNSVKRAEAILMMVGVRKTEICYTADEAMELLQKGFRPDIALIAPELKGIHGITLIKNIRSFLKDEKSGELPILLVISSPSKEVIRHACRAGIEGVIRKPLEHNKIGRLIHSAVTKPRRFIAIREYFGLERRTTSDSSYQGPERRKALADHEAIATKARSDAAPPKKAKLAEEATVNKLERVTPISEYQLPTPLELKAASELKGGKLIEDDELLVPAKKPEVKIEPKPVEKPKPVAKPVAKPAEKKPVEQAAPKPTKPVKKPVVAQAKPEAEAPKPKPEKAPAKAKKPVVEEVEIVDIDEALLNHRLWVDSAGREGQAISVERANLRGVNLEAADLTGASLIEANFTDANLTEAVLRKANLSGAVFSNTQLIGANLAVARMKKANLSNARLDRAVLRGADLSGARFRGASLLRIDLSSANLANADLIGANLSSAIGLIQEQVDRAYIDNKTTLPAGLEISPAVLARSAKAGLSGLKAKAVGAPVKE